MLAFVLQTVEVVSLRALGNLSVADKAWGLSALRCVDDRLIVAAGHSAQLSIDLQQTARLIIAGRAAAVLIVAVVAVGAGRYAG